MLLQAVTQFLEGRGWKVYVEGHVLTAEGPAGTLVLGFLNPGEAEDFAIQYENSTAQLGAILLEPLPDDDVVRLEESGVHCFEREAIEDLIVAGWTGRKASDPGGFLPFLEGG